MRFGSYSARMKQVVCYNKTICTHADQVAIHMSDECVCVCLR